MDTWLKCKIQEGQFSEEFVVEGKDAAGTPFSLFARHSDVDTEGWIRVKVLAQQNGLCLVQLPQETLENGSTVTVLRDDLEEFPARQEV